MLNGGPPTRTLLWIFVLLSLAAAPTAQAGQCLADIREVSLGPGKSVRLRDFLCRSANGNAAIRVQKHRLTDMALHSLLENDAPPALLAAFGRFVVIETPALHEFNNLMSRFGRLSVYSTIPSFSVQTPPAGRGISISDFGGQNGDIFGQSKPRRNLGASDHYEMDFPAPDMKHRLRINQQRWRYLSNADLKNFRRNVRRQSRQIGRNLYWDQAVANQARVRVDLLNYISGGKLPSGFQLLVASNWEGGCDTGGFDVKLYPRQLVADTVLIENTGSNSIELNEFRGSSSQSTSLRRTRKLPISSAKLPIGYAKLNPGDRVLLVTGLRFVVNEVLAEKLKNDSIFKRKKPRLPNFDFGPRFSIDQLVIDGEPHKFEFRSANFLALTTGIEEGSCPYLYAWHEEVGEWVSYQKVLHTANGASHKGTAEKNFEGFRGRFQLVENEAEVAYIDRAHLDVKLKTGVRLKLLPDQKVLKREDGWHRVLHWGDKTKFSFKLPDWANAEDVETSKLAITGYYDRYSTVLAGKRCTRPAQAQIVGSEESESIARPLAGSH